MSEATRSGLPHVPALDGLRGIAVAGVLAFHAGHLRGGYLGVDLFFVLSGFLITGLLVSEHRQTDAIALGAFWQRRARRLLPALFVLLAVVTCWASRRLPPEDLGRVRGDAIASLLYVANWRAIATGDDYWALFSAPSPLEHMWSLAIEEQFYLLWPPIVLVALRVGRRSLRAPLIVTTLLLGVSMLVAWRLHHPGAGTARVYFGTDTRASSLLFGALLALVTARGPWASSRSARLGVELAGLVSVAGLACAWFFLRGENPWLHRGGLFACGLLAVLVIAAASHPRVGPLARVLSWSPLRALGNISYGLYLWHWPVFVLVAPTSLRIALSLALSIGSYYAIERPFRRGSFSLRRSAVLASLGFVGTSAIVLAATRGATERSAVGTAVEPTPEPLLPTKTDGSPRRYLVVGDSVGDSLRSASEPVAAELAVVIRNRSVTGCGLVRGSQRIRLPGGKITVRAVCSDWESRWAKDVQEIDPDVVLLVLDAPTLGDLDIDGRWLHPCDADLDGRYEQDATRAIDVLGAHGALVAVATAAYVDRRGDDNRARTDCVNRALRGAVARTTRGRVADLGEWVCPNGACRIADGGVELRPDGTHFSAEAAPIALRWLLRASLAFAP